MTPGSGPVVTCLGILVADVVGRPVDDLPPPGALRLVERMGLFPGGCAGNTASALARLGFASSVIGAVGDDVFGRLLVESLRREGVNTAAIRVMADQTTSSTMVLVASSGERTFLHLIGANGALTAADVDLSLAGPSDHLHVAGAGLMPALDGAALADVCAGARRLGMTVSVDTAWSPYGRWSGMLAALEHTDFFLPSLEEGRRITGEDDPEGIAAAAMDHGAGVVVVKMGERGCYVRAHAGRPGVYLPAVAAPFVDGTGAGDAFCAGFIAGLRLNWDVVKAARLATATGAIAVTALGAISAIRSLDDAVRVMQRGSAWPAGDDPA